LRCDRPGCDLASFCCGLNPPWTSCIVAPFRAGGGGGGAEEQGRFGDALGDARAAMTALAKSMPPSQLARHAYRLYEQFRPEIPGGSKGWGAKGRLSLDKIRSMAE
ncbi:MAG TPA: hypothetical protein VLL72_12490, partial [Kiloniellales bacterium]|nr:hypothetical protein [Kiloniellales bacterium]